LLVILTIEVVQMKSTSSQKKKKKKKKKKITGFLVIHSCETTDSEIQTFN